jgi:hypothetical protein
MILARRFSSSQLQPSLSITTLDRPTTTDTECMTKTIAKKVKYLLTEQGCKCEISANLFMKSLIMLNL